MHAPLHALRAKAAAAVVLGLALVTAGHAAARNHDCQAFRQPAATVLAVHDRAPGPLAAARLPN